MFNNNIMRSIATLGVVAGLLAAAGPASAQFWEGQSLRSQAPGAMGVIAPDNDLNQLSEVFPSVSNVKGAAFRGEVIGLEPHALGTQVGSEGVKLNTLGGDDSLDVVADAGSAQSLSLGISVDAGSGDDKLHDRGTEVGIAAADPQVCQVGW
jgi:hypothetical protein